MSFEETEQKLPAAILVVNKDAAALRQLEAAILLWFNHPDPVSIHTLAVAAHACYRGVAKHAGIRSSVFQDWLKSQTPEVRRVVQDTQNFFKHADRDKKGAKTAFTPLHAEMLMLESAAYHEQLSGDLTPLMRGFAIRFVGENPHIISTENAGTIFRQIDSHSSHGLKIDELFKLERREFLVAIAGFLSNKPS